MKRLLIDIGSTYFKVCDNGHIVQHFRDFNTSIKSDLYSKCASTVESYDKDKIHICSSANGGLSTLIIGLTNSFSLQYAINIAFNAGINIIDTVLYPKIKEYGSVSEIIDVVIVVGGIDSVKNVFDKKLLQYLRQIKYQNIVYVGSKQDRGFLAKNIQDITLLENIITNKLKVNDEELKNYLTNLYQADIMGKEDIKELYEITSNQIFSTPYVVNQTMPLLKDAFEVVDPFILVDIGGATTDIHYSKDLSVTRFTHDGDYDRYVFKKLGVFKSRESLIFAAKNNEFVYELLAYLNVTENILDENGEQAIKILMQLSIFLVLYKMSKRHEAYVTLKLEQLKSIIFTGGITKVLAHEDIDAIISFFYKKILGYHVSPVVIIDAEYKIWTIGGQDVSE